MGRVIYDDEDEFSRALGDTDEEIAEAKLLVDIYFPPDEVARESHKLQSDDEVKAMSHVIELTDEAYEAVEAAASKQGVTPQAYVEMFAASLRKPRRVYDNLDDFFRSLGDTDEEIEQSKHGIDEMFPPDDPTDE